MLDMAMVAQCSPNMHPAIVQAIVETESSFNPFAIGVNRGSRLTRQPSNFGEAVQTAKRLLEQGANIDMGLGQINSANLQWLGLTVEQAFTPCVNLQTLQHVYLHCYNKAGKNGLGDRMQRAFSCYNTGNFTKGFFNGYVAKATNNLNNLVGKVANSNEYLPQPTYVVKNGSIIAIEQHKDNKATQVPTNDKNTDIGVSVRTDDYSDNQPQIPKEIQAENVPVKVHNSWDIFRDF